MDNKKIDIESMNKSKIHQVPDGYFDELPLKIQTRINSQQEQASPVFISRMQLTWSMTAALLIFLIGWIFYPQSIEQSNIDQILADIDSEYLIEYLQEEDITTDEILASLDNTYIIEELDAIESETIGNDLSDEELEMIYSEIDYSTEIM